MGEDEARRKEITYADAGVDIIAGDTDVERIKPFCKATNRSGCDVDLGGFGGLFDLAAAGYANKTGGNGEDTILVSCTDGVDTKLKLAQIAQIHHTVGIDLVAMSVNDCIVQRVEPLLFLGYFVCGKLDVEVAIRVIQSIAKGCEMAICGLIGGETAAMPSMYDDGEYDLAGFCVGGVKRKDILPKMLVEEDALIGIASSGIHSNGYSLVRKLADLSGLKLTDPAPFAFTFAIYEDPNKPNPAEALLEPTMIYTKQVLATIQARKLQALAHITGEGIMKNLPRLIPSGFYAEINLDTWKLLRIFQWMAGISNVSEKEMLKTFNCGVGMIVAVKPQDVEEALKLLQYSIPKQRVSICSKIYMYIYNIIIQLRIFKFLHFLNFSKSPLKLKFLE